jgi:hypothetical protein
MVPDDGVVYQKGRSWGHLLRDVAINLGSVWAAHNCLDHNGGVSLPNLPNS